MTKLFLSANSVLALVFTSALVFSASASFAAQGLELRIDSDNNGVIDNSSWERRLTKNPYAFGKFIPYSETDEEFVEIQVVVPQAKSANEKRTLKFTFESNEVSLWVATPDGKKEILFMPDVKDATQEVKKPENAKTKSSAKSKKHKAHSNFDFNNIVKFLWDRNIDEVQQEEPITEIVEIFKPQTFEYSILSGKTILTFYLQAETKPLPADWQNSKTFKRPTRTLSVNLILNGQSIASDSAKYMVVGKESIYAAIQMQPLLSEAIAASSVYFDNANVMKYGLQVLTLKDMGISSDDIHFDDSGFSVRCYRDWVHDKYYVTFKGTEIRLSDITNDVFLCTGNPSDYLWKAFQLGYLLRTKPEIPREKIVIIGHSLGGALASGACMVSEIKTDTFNALGLPYLTIKNTLDGYRKETPAADFYQQQIEKSFFPPKDINKPNDRDFNSQNVPLFTFYTQHDILTLLEEHINAQMRMLNGTKFDILPSALGREIEIEKLGQNVQPINKDLSTLRDAIVVLNRILEVLIENNQDLTWDNIRNQWKILKSKVLEMKKLKLKIFNLKDIKRRVKDIDLLIKCGKLISNCNQLDDQFDYSVQCHTMDAVIEEILIQSGMPEAYGKAGNRE